MYVCVRESVRVCVCVFSCVCTKFCMSFIKKLKTSRYICKTIRYILK